MISQAQANLEQFVLERNLWMKKSPAFRADAIKKILYRLKNDGKERSDPFFLIRARSNLANNVYVPEDYK